MTEIADYAFLSDCRSGALVSREGSVDWLCLPRFDSPSLFGRVLDPDAGHWAISPVDEHRSERSYRTDTLVLTTRFSCSSGEVEITDAMALEPGADGHEIGMRSPHVLLRECRGVSGEVEMASTVRPRFEYGITVPRVAEDGPDVRFTGGAGTLVLRCDAPVQVDGGEVRSRFTVRQGERIGFSLAYAPTFGGVPAVLGASEAIRDTTRGWRSWADVHWGEGRGYDGRYIEQVRRSALVLQGLTHQPSGAVAAALTTSLPEHVGGGWNWDYRYSWLRDASLMMHALWVAACPDEPERFFRWLANAGGQTDGSQVQIVYGLEGERDLTEHEVRHLRGFADSTPVRIGNDAWTQKQLDVLGEVLDAAYVLSPTTPEWSEETRELLVAFADAAAKRWTEPDAGMWEARDAERHYTSSKVMCWVAMDRALALADRLRATAEQRERWARESRRCRDRTLAEAWSESRHAFCGALGSDRLDASVLLMPIVGFIPAEDERMASTIRVVREGLCEGGLVKRWEDEANGFLLAGFWLVRCLALLGDLDGARRLFDEAASYGNDLGLFAEMGDVRSGEPIGNFPQAFSHVGLINAAWVLTQAEDRANGERTPREATPHHQRR